MVRSRWAVLALATCALFTSGCGNWNECGGGGGLFSRFRTTSLTRDCECCDTSLASPLVDGPVLAPPEGHFMPPTTTVPPTAFPPTAPPPRIVPIPHAAPIPYTPLSRTDGK